MTLDVGRVASELGLDARAVEAIVEVLRDRSLPGEPLSDEAIVEVLPDVRDVCDAETVRWLRACAAGALPADDSSPE
ncbi:hypothetical protein [Streptomyces xiamenensis]|uniref:hypothetical protein n=1 Tax=Streptomyces xiamenensis TaxID=408015 RepID=UPI0037D2B00D